jgi:hypothetical protein
VTSDDASPGGNGDVVSSEASPGVIDALSEGVVSSVGVCTSSGGGVDVLVVQDASASEAALTKKRIPG